MSLETTCLRYPGFARCTIQLRDGARLFGHLSSQTIRRRWQAALGEDERGRFMARQPRRVRTIDATTAQREVRFARRLREDGAR